MHNMAILRGPGAAFDAAARIEIGPRGSYVSAGHMISDTIMRERWGLIVFSRRSRAMNPATSSCKVCIILALGVVGLAGIGAAAAEPDSENGRYTFSSTPDGMMRLDTRTGVVSRCSNSGAGWACYAMPDERKALDEEIGRLEAENQKLKAQLAARDGAVAGNDKPAAADGQRKIEIPLPSDQDVDRVMSFLQRAWKRLVDMASQMQKDVAGDGKI
jgi:hypothetical protein